LLDSGIEAVFAVLKEALLEVEVLWDSGVLLVFVVVVASVLEGAEVELEVVFEESLLVEFKPAVLFDFAELEADELAEEFDRFGVFVEFE